MSFGIQVLGLALGILGWLGSIVACALPQWKVTAFIGNNIVTAQIYWEGLWMTCVVQSTGQMQCKVYDSMLALSVDLKASRAILVISLLVAIVAGLAGIAGGKCTNCLEEGSGKARVAITAGVLFLTAGVLGLIPPSWTAHQVITDFYNPFVHEAMKRELGAGVFIGWASAVFMVIGGGLLCSSCQQNKAEETTRYKIAPDHRKDGTSYL
ncbi:claudin-like protein ZF-A9 [Osmerus eperlanus]|uniref:claudin-like protein ZF-A9 n=1 Tax=Osmerus eperlanus TaxID=29151 RepID=UPI002E0DD6DA